MNFSVRLFALLLAGAPAYIVPSMSGGYRQERPRGAVTAGAAQPKLVAKQFKFTEGPAVDRAGNVYFTDQPNNKIWK